MRSKNIDIAIVAAIAWNSVAALLVGAGWLSYYAGSMNDALPFLAEMGLMAFGALLALVVLVAGLIRFPKWRAWARIAWFAFMPLPLVVGIASNFVVQGSAGLDQYERGFQHWAGGGNIDAAAVRVWLAIQILPGAPLMTTTVAPADWPVVLAKLHPREMALCGSGVIVTFGTFGTWGDQRQVFIGTNAAAGNPGIILWGRIWHATGVMGRSPWVEAKPGVWVWVQSGG